MHPIFWTCWFWKTVRSLSQIGQTWYLNFITFFAILIQPKFKGPLLMLNIKFILFDTNFALKFLSLYLTQWTKFGCNSLLSRKVSIWIFKILYSYFLDWVCFHNQLPKAVKKSSFLSVFWFLSDSLALFCQVGIIRDITPPFDMTP